MTPDFSLCDICGKKAPQKPIWVGIGRKMDPAGSMEDEGHNVDLCPEHAIQAIQVMLQKDQAYEFGNRLWDWVKLKQKSKG